MPNVFVIGHHSHARFQKWPDKSVKDLGRDSLRGCAQDAGSGHGDRNGLVFQYRLGPCAATTRRQPGKDGQMNVRGQVALAPLIKDGLFPTFAPITNVEGACASGSIAFHGAWTDVLAGKCDVSLAIGAEKLVYPEYMDWRWDCLQAVPIPKSWRNYPRSIRRPANLPARSGSMTAATAFSWIFTR